MLNGSRKFWKDVSLVWKKYILNEQNGSDDAKK